MADKIYIRVDGGSEIGLGHLVRCIALAEMIKRDFVIHFVCKEVPASIESQFIQSGFFFTRIASESEFFDLLKRQDIVVLDHYGFDLAYQKRIKDLGNKLVCIDDLHEQEFYADLLINHSPGVVAEMYSALPYTQFALGIEYALLRPQFLEQAKYKRKIQTIRSVFICFGGSDPKNLTLQVLRVVLEFEAFDQIIVVTGAGYRELNSLGQFIANISKITHFHAVEEAEMLRLMLLAELAIVPSSGILLEVLAVGSCVISGSYVDNQKRLFENFKKMKSFVSAEDFSDSSLRIALNEALQKTKFDSTAVDGRSPERILKIFHQLADEKFIKLRRAQLSDADITYNWAIDKMIRAYSFNSDAITSDEHLTWFTSKINSPDCYYYIAEFKKKIIGSIRFDVKEGQAVISYLLDSNYHNKGLGILLLKAGIATVMKETRASFTMIIGFVMLGNKASSKVFEKLGFTETCDGKKLKYTYIIERTNAD